MGNIRLGRDMPFSLRQFEPADAHACQQLFLDTVHRVNVRDYTPRQLEAWAPSEIDSTAWARRFAGRFAYVAVEAGRLVGFTDT